MRLFAFGLGYCARAAIAWGRGVEASGTVRSAEAAGAIIMSWCAARLPVSG